MEKHDSTDNNRLSRGTNTSINAPEILEYQRLKEDLLSSLKAKTDYKRLQ